MEFNTFFTHLTLLFYVFIITCSTFQFGYGVGVVNNTKTSLTQCQNSENFFKNCIPMKTTIQWSFFVGIYPIGAMIGAVSAGPFGNFFGRKVCLVLVNVMFSISIFIMSFFSNYYTLYFGRLLNGFCSGFSSMIVPLYILEISPSRFRGAYGSLNQLQICFGVFFGMLFGYIFDSIDQGWRIAYSINIIPCAITLLFAPILPHSPRWLLLKGYEELGRKTLELLRWTKDVDEELEEIKEGLQGKTGDFADTFRSNMIKPLLISFLVCIGQQVSGPNIINFYSTEIFKNSGVEHPELATTVVGAVKVLLTVPCILLVDKFGRRFLLLTGTFLELISFIGLGISYIFAELSPIISYISVITVITHTIGYSFSIGPLTWILPSELFPNDVRNFGLMICTALNWFTSFIISISFPLISNLLGKFVFIPFMGMFILFYVMFVLFVPETKGKSMEELTNKI